MGVPVLVDTRPHVTGVNGVTVPCYHYPPLATNSPYILQCFIGIGWSYVIIIDKLLHLFFQLSVVVVFATKFKLEIDKLVKV